MWSSAFSGRICAQRYSTSLTDCWGHFAPTGGCTGTDTSSVPTHEPTFDSAISVALGTSHWCAIDSTGIVQCAGNNQYGQLAREPAMNTDFPTFRPVCITSACVP